jgi:type VI secretion system protein ImpM
MAESAGWFGKVSCLGDFASRRLAPDWVSACDAWLAQSMALSQRELGSQWMQVYLQAPLWRFAWAPGVADSRWWFGVLMPSCDSVGRYFPLMVVQARDRAPADRIGLDHLELWWSHLAQAALATLGEGRALEAFEEDLLDAPPWPGAGPALFGEPGGDAARRRHPLAAGAGLGQVMHGIAQRQVQDALQGCTLWWPMHEGGGPGSFSIARGLPDPARYADLLRGAW